MTRKQIADALNDNVVKISHTLNRLLKWNEICFKEYSVEEAAKILDYPIHRRIRFYFLSN